MCQVATTWCAPSFNIKHYTPPPRTLLPFTPPHAPHNTQMDGQRIQSANIPVTLDASGATYMAKGLTPGNQYKIAVSAE